LVEFGPLITLYQACCGSTPRMLALLRELKDYQDKRNRLAHKMFSEKRLTPKECGRSLARGKEIIQVLDYLLENRRKRAEEKT